MKPVLFQIFGMPVYGYGVMLGLSCVGGAHIALYLCERSGISEKQAWRMILAVIVVGLIGGRVHDLAVTGNLTFDELFKLQHSGRTAYGAFVTATIAGVIMAKLLKVPFWRFADAAAPTMALGLGLTRIGCFLFGCDYGMRSDTWGVAFPQNSPAWQDQHLAGTIPADAIASLPVFPAQLLSSLAGFLIFGLTLWFWFRRPRREGSVLLLFFGSYGLARAALEVIRDDAGRGTLLGMSTSQAIGLGTALGALAFALLPPLVRMRPEAGPVLDVLDPDADPAAADASPEASPDAAGEAETGGSPA